MNLIFFHYFSCAFISGSLSLGGGDKTLLGITLSSMKISEFYEQIISSYSPGFLSAFYGQTSEMHVCAGLYLPHG